MSGQVCTLAMFVKVLQKTLCNSELTSEMLWDTLGKERNKADNQLVHQFIVWQKLYKFWIKSVKRSPYTKLSLLNPDPKDR